MNIKKILILTFIPHILYAEVYDYKITRVIDGDTVEFQAPFLPKPLKPTLSLRVYGVDTPEKLTSECEMEHALAMEATEFTTSLVKNSKKHQIIIKNWDKYGGRVDGDIILDGKSLRASLLEKGFAHLYYGDKKKSSWCDK